MKTLGVRTVSLTEAMGEVSERLRREKVWGTGQFAIYLVTVGESMRLKSGFTIMHQRFPVLMHFKPCLWDQPKVGSGQWQEV